MYIIGDGISKRRKCTAALKKKKNNGEIGQWMISTTVPEVRGVVGGGGAEVWTQPKIQHNAPQHVMFF